MPLLAGVTETLPVLSHSHWWPQVDGLASGSWGFSRNFHPFSPGKPTQKAIEAMAQSKVP